MCRKEWKNSCFKMYWEENSLLPFVIKAREQLYDCWSFYKTSIYPDLSQSHRVSWVIPNPQMIHNLSRSQNSSGHGTKSEKGWSTGGRAGGQSGRLENKPPCLVGLSKCLFQKTDWNKHSRSNGNDNDRVQSQMDVCAAESFHRLHVNKTHLANLDDCLKPVSSSDCWIVFFLYIYMYK